MIVSDISESAKTDDEPLTNADAAALPLPTTQAAAERSKSKGENTEV